MMERMKILVWNLLPVFLGQSERIMYAEMVNPGKLFSVCEGIKISRIKKDFLTRRKIVLFINWFYELTRNVQKLNYVQFDLYSRY